MGKSRTDAGSRNGLACLILFFIFGLTNVLTAQNRFPFRVEPSGKPHLYGFIDRTGKTVIAPVFTQVQGFCDGYCAVQNPESKLWGIIDSNGKELTPPKYPAVLTSFRCGFGAVGSPEKDSLLLYVNVRGKVIFKSHHLWVNLWNPESHSYEGVHEFKEFFSVYGKADPSFAQVYFLDTAGKFLNKEPFFSAEPFAGGRTQVVLPSQKKVFIDKTGKILINPPPQKSVVPFMNLKIEADRIHKVKFFNNTERRFFLPDGSVMSFENEHLAGFGTAAVPPKSYHKNPVSYYNFKEEKWVWKKNNPKIKNIAGTYLYLQKGKPAETLVLRCPSRDVLEVEYFSEKGDGKVLKVEVKDYNPNTLSFKLKFKGFDTFYPGLLRMTHTLVINNPGNVIQEFIRVGE